MNALRDALNPKVREELMGGRTIDVMSVAFEIEADPSRPDDEGAIKRNISMADAFNRNLPWLNDELAGIRALCNGYGEDFDRPAETLLSAALLAKRYEIEEVKEWNPTRPLLSLVTPMVGIWAMAWTVTPEQKNNSSSPVQVRPEIGYKEYLNDSVMDPETIVKVRRRMRDMNEVMERVLKRLTEG